MGFCLNSEIFLWKMISHILSYSWSSPLTQQRTGPVKNPTGLKIQVNGLIDKNGREHEIGRYFHVNRRELLVRK